MNTRKAGIALRTRLNIPSPLKVIRDNCLECAGGSPAAVKSCVVVKCRMWPYRFGRNPKRDDLKTAGHDSEGNLTGQTDYPGLSPEGEEQRRSEMTLLAGILGFLLIVALLYIAAERFTAWLTRHGGITIRIEPVEDEDD